MMSSGFQIEENIFTFRECDALANALEKGPIDRGKAGARNLMTLDLVSSLALDPRLLALTKSAFGYPLIPYKATLFEKTGKANWLVAWHQDTALPIEKFEPRMGWTAPSVKAGRLFAQAPAAALAKILALRIHLDDSTETNGPLRVIPSSHKDGVLSDAKINELAGSRRGVKCLVRRGGVIAMSPL